MATIRNSISMQDNMSPVFKSIIRAMDSTLSAMKKFDSTASRGIPAKSFRDAQSAINSASNALIKYQNNIQKANEESSNLNNKLNSMSSRGGFNALNIYALVGLIKQTSQLVDKTATYLDDMALIQSRVKMINDGMQTTGELQDKILASANRARSSYADTTNAVTKLNMLAGDQFKTNDEAINFIETLNKMFIVSGTSGQEATAAMYQLTQAMGAGKLQGDEFRSIMENAPMLADAIAKSMKKSKAELKELSSKGKITAEVIKKAMKDSTEEINKLFKEMPMTFGQSMTIVKNNFMNEMKPVAAWFSQWVNSSAGSEFFDTIAASMVKLAAIGVWVVQNIAKGVSWLKTNFEYIEPVILGLGAAMVFAGISSAVAWTMANLPLLAIIATVAILTYVFNLLGINIGTIISTVISWFSYFWDILSSLLPLIYAIGAAVLAYFLIPLILSIPGIIAGLWAMIPPMLTQLAIWLAMNWPILLVAAAIGILIYIMGQFGVTTADVIGFIVGLFYALGAEIYNMLIELYNRFLVFANFLSNLFIDPIGAIKMFFLDMATYIIDKVRWVAEALQDLVNMIPGVEVNIVAGLDNIKAQIEATKQAVSNETGVKQTQFKQYKSLSTQFNKGFDKGSNFVKSFGGGKVSGLSSLLSKFKIPEMPKGYGMDKGIGGMGKAPGAPTGLGKDGKLKGGKLDKVGKIDGDVKITDEDIKLLKDISKAEFINKYTTLRPNMNVQFTGSIHETADVNKILEAIEDMTEEALSNTLVEGVYA